MPVKSFTAKQLRFTLILASPNTTFPGTNSNTLQLTGVRSVCRIESTARQAWMADIKIYGMSQATMNALTVVWFKPPAVKNNQIIVEANNGDGWTQVFSGTMIEAQPDYRGAPDVFFHIQGYAGYLSQISAAPPSSYTGDTSVATIVQSLAGAMGFAFENNGVTTTLSSPYLAGTYFDQLISVCKAANVDFYFQGSTLAICPAGGNRSKIPAVILGPDSGLIGYPVIERSGIALQALFNPAFANGGQIQVQSDIPAAVGTWTVYRMIHYLDSLKPDGQWFTELHCWTLLNP